MLVITILYELGGLFAHFLLGQPAPAGKLVFGALPGELLLNLILTAPVYLLCRWTVGKLSDEQRATEVKLLA